jgi:drug/metabolite transporter (DMT)-like permease
MVEFQPSKLAVRVRFPSPAPIFAGWFRFAPLIFVLLWSGGFSALKIGVAYTGPITFLALRYALVLVVLGPIALVWRPRLPHGRQWLHLAMIGLLIQFGYFVLNNIAFTLGMSASVLALLVSLQPILVAVLAPLLGQEGVSAWQWMGLLLGLLGAAMVILAHSALQTPTTGGLICAVVAVLALTGGTLYEKRFGPPVHPLSANLVYYAVGLAAALPLAAWLEPMHVVLAPGLIISMAYLVIANSIISLSLLLMMIRRGAVARVSALFFLVPPVASAMAWLTTGETLTPVALAGMALAAVGVVVASRAAGGK